MWQFFSSPHGAKTSGRGFYKLHNVESGHACHRRGPYTLKARVGRGRRVQQCWPDDALQTLSWSEEEQEPVLAPPSASPIVLLPGFGNNTTDYTAPFGRPQEGLVTHLQERGWHVSPVQLERKDWFKVARNLLTLRFWSGGLTTHPGYTWYLERIAAAVDAAREATGSDTVTLVGHSAGGWLGRAFLADPAYATSPAGGLPPSAPNPAVAALVTLGSPHQPPPRGAARDMTGGALTWVDSSFPGAHYAEQGVRYVCVAGRAVRGSAAAPRRSLPAYAASSYQQVLGVGDGVVGDAVVPLACATLEGATNLVLDGVFHSMAAIGSFDDGAPPGQVWYGSAGVVDTWLACLVDGGGRGGAQATARAAAAGASANSTRAAA